MDDGFDAGDAISPSYDSLMAKLVAHAPDREDARCALRGALRHVLVRGVRTNVYFLGKCIETKEFAEGAHYVGLVAERLRELTDRSRLLQDVATAAACIDVAKGEGCSAWNARDGWRANAQPRLTWSFTIDGENQNVTLSADGRGAYRRGDGAKLSDISSSVGALLQLEGRESVLFRFNNSECGVEYVQQGDATFVFHEGDVFEVLPSGAAREHADGAAGDEVKAPLPGKVVGIAARTGLAVKKGDPLITLEAMKMEHALKAPRDGIVAEIAVKAGAQVKEGALLVRLEEEAE
jgi:acetyl/propionyl-CoA carboxylase alpha subunit